MPTILAAVLGYLLGSVPFGLLLTRAAGLGDIRQVGSGNIGATNVLRTGRRGLAAVTLLLDAAKGAAAVLLGRSLGGEWGACLGGIAAVAGHLFPVWLGFRGGKGVATGLGALIAANPVVGLGAGLVWCLTAYGIRMSSVASLASFLVAPVLALLARDWPVFVLALAASTLIWWRHEGNIRRILAGTEPRIGKS